MEPSKSLPPYRYRPLQASADSIRLLRLEPALSNDEHLRGSLVTRTLSSFGDDLNFHYAALSYVWGDLSRTKGIELLVGDEHFRHGLTDNLHDALVNIREEHRAIFVWADAICIDQNNTSERGHQVKLMGNIYRNAGCTIIYLGHSNPAIKCLFMPITHQPVAGQIEKLKSAVEDLCSREWFSRGWVFQELVLSRNPRVQVGQFRIGWSQLYSSVHHELPTTGPGDMVRTMNTAYNDRRSRTFSQLVISRKGTLVSDPRDYFFCLMGIASDADAVQHFLPIDYSQGVKDVFAKAASYIANDLGLYALVAHFDSDINRFGLPWFAPAWGVSSLETTSHDSPGRFISSSSEVNVLNQRLIIPIPDESVFKITVLSAVTTSENSFIFSFNQNLAAGPEIEIAATKHHQLVRQKTIWHAFGQVVKDRYPNVAARVATVRDVTSPWKGESDRTATTKHHETSMEEKKCYWKHVLSPEKAKWHAFGKAVREKYESRQAANSANFEETRQWPRILDEDFQAPADYKAFWSAIERTVRDLSRSNDDLFMNYETPRYRWALFDRFIGLVPADTVCGDRIAMFQGGIGLNQEIKWFVLRPVNEDHFQRQYNAAFEHIGNGYGSSLPRYDSEKHKRMFERKDAPIEVSFRNGEVKGSAVVFEHFR